MRQRTVALAAALAAAPPGGFPGPAARSVRLTAHAVLRCDDLAERIAQVDLCASNLKRRQDERFANPERLQERRLDSLARHGGERIGGSGRRLAHGSFMRGEIPSGTPAEGSFMRGEIPSRTPAEGSSIEGLRPSGTPAEGSAPPLRSAPPGVAGEQGA